MDMDENIRVLDKVTTMLLKAAGLVYLLSILGRNDSRVIHAAAVPGLTTLLDVALFKSNEGCLTATVCAAESLLAAMLQLKQLSKQFLKELILTELHAPPPPIPPQHQQNHSSQNQQQNQQQQQQQQQQQNSNQNHRHNHKRNSNNHNNSNHNSNSANSIMIRELAESFARLCLDCANGCIQVLTCDRFAQSANIDVHQQNLDHFSSFYSNNDPSKSSSSSPTTNTTRNTHSSDHLFSSFFHHDNARPKQPKPSDCWESPRLFCPDYIWAEEAIQHCLKSLKLMTKHRFLSTDKTSTMEMMGMMGIGIGMGGGIGGGINFDSMTAAASAASAAAASSVASLHYYNDSSYYNKMASSCNSTFNQHASSSSSSYSASSNNSYSTSSSTSPFTTTCTEWMWPHLPSSCLIVADQIYHMLKLDLPTKLCQFRTAVESETVVSKRLYLIKCEYRAPFRTFLESTAMVLKAPMLRSVNRYIDLHTDTHSGHKSQFTRHNVKINSFTTTHDTNDENTKTDNTNKVVPQDSSISSSTNTANTQVVNSALFEIIEKQRDETEKIYLDCLHHPHLVKALKMEQHLELLEMGMSQLLLPFCELSRLLELKKCRIVPHWQLLKPHHVPALRELVYRLQFVLVSKKMIHQGVGSSSTASSSSPCPNYFINLNSNNMNQFHGSNHFHDHYNTNSGSGGGIGNNSGNSGGGSANYYYYNNNDHVRSSYGIRPILVDLQGIIPREDSPIDPFAPIFTTSNISQKNDTGKQSNEIFLNNTTTTKSNNDPTQKRLELFLFQLRTLTSIIQTKGALFSLDKKDYDIPPILIQKCNSFDSELFEAQFQDWWTLVKLQNEHINSEYIVGVIDEEDVDGNKEKSETYTKKQASLPSENSKNSDSTTTATTRINGDDDEEENVINKTFSNLTELVKQTQKSEMEMSLAMSSYSTLLNVKKKVESYHKDANRHFDVLKETVLDVGLREMNLKVRLEKPRELLLWTGDMGDESEDDEEGDTNDDRSVDLEQLMNISRELELKETGALGIFGKRLIAAGEKLPLG